MKMRFLFLSLLFCAFNASGQKVIFLHHSTGEGVYVEGKVADWFASYNTSHSTSYQVTERNYPNSPYPWQNYPYDYWNLWVNGGCDSSNPNIECLSSLCSNYNVIIYKHCFPGADILADEGVPSVSSETKTLANYKLQFRALRNEMDKYPQNKFIVWTLTPLHRLNTNAENAARAKQFVDWVKKEWLSEDGKAHPNIFIFDFWSYTAESNSNPTNGMVNCLKYDYELSHSEGNSHPNTAANEYIGPKFAEFIVSVLQNQITHKVELITITGKDNKNVISVDKGTLQMQASVLPANATNKSVTWAIGSGSEYGSISSSGLLSAIKNGVVTIKATAVDGSGISGNTNITISNQIVKATAISIGGSTNQNTITTLGGTLQLQVDFTPADVTDKTVTWSVVSGNSYASVSSSGLISALQNGHLRVRATANDGSGVHGEVDIMISGQETSIEIGSQEEFSFYPNPARDVIYTNNVEGTTGCLSIFSLTGIKLKDLEFTNGSISISDLKKGCYIVYFYLNNKCYTDKLVIYEE